MYEAVPWPMTHVLGRQRTQLRKPYGHTPVIVGPASQVCHAMHGTKGGMSGGVGLVMGDKRGGGTPPTSLGSMMPLPQVQALAACVQLPLPLQTSTVHAFKSDVHDVPAGLYRQSFVQQPVVCTASHGLPTISPGRADKLNPCL